MTRDVPAFFLGKKVLVTGAAGFIGRRLTRALTGAGVQVVGWDIVADPEFPGKEFITAGIDTIEPDDLTRLDVDLIFHLAAVVGVSAAATLADSTQSTIVDGTSALLKAAAESSHPHIVFVSSSEVYGESATFPIVESLPHNPLSVYGRAKAQAEGIIQSHAKAHGSRATIIRPFNVYGPEQRLDFVIPRFVDQALRNEPITIVGDGTQLRTFTHVDDFVRGMLHVVGADAEPASVYNVAGSETWTIEGAAATIIRTLGSSSELRFTSPESLGRPASYEIRNRVASYGKAFRTAGYVPEIGLVEGIRQIASAMGAHVPSNSGAQA